MRDTVASRCRALAPWLAASALVLATTALCIRVLQSQLRPVGALDLPALALFGLTILAAPASALVLAYRAHLREARQRSEVESLLAIMRDVHAAAGTEAAAGVLLEHARSLVGATGAALVLHTAEGRVLRAQVDGRERARRSLTGETTPPERTLFDELAFTSVIDLSNTRPERRTGLTGLGLPAAIVVALRGETRIVGLLAVERPESFSLRERRLLETVGTHAGSALESGQTARALVALTELKERLAHEARHDPLTGLANRSLFSLRVEAALARDDNAPAVMFLDLDDFKNVNDTLGHATGDALLVTVAERLRASLREDDLAARLGGDEFAVLLEHAPTAVEAERAAERVLGALLAPLRVEGHSVRVRASIGVALASGGAHTADELLRNADLAMYAAKSAGRSRSAIFSPGMHDAELARHALVGDLREAIAQGQIEPFFQPLVDLGSGRSWAVEALARWHHPRLGLLLPERFIELAEETDLIDDLGRGMLRAACRQAVIWRENVPGAAELVVSVNVSRRQLEDVGFTDLVAETLERESLPPGALMLELTESAVASDAAQVIRHCSALRTLGVRVAVDDFGTGTSSLAELRDLPVDVLKLGKPFVDALETRPGEREFVRVIVELGRVLGLIVAAEGVETEGQLTLLRELGVDVAQGNLMAAAQAAVTVERHLRSPPETAAA
ncbi:MAG: EAL domain-containing protein [Actinomycetota bacterium]|nr:EAL domain-containing protein [Actinomycetota bacterium]